MAVATAIFSLSASADEGMWVLPLLQQQNLPEMRALGLKLQDYEIYSPENASLKDAVVIFGGGCTGEVVSPDGLVLTNHHCGYGAIQSHSTLEHDYLTEGFWATSRSEELPNPGLSVTFIDRIEDVTDYVKEALKKDNDPEGMNYLSPKYLNGLAKARVGEKFLADNPGTEVEIKPFYGGNQYYMFTKKIYRDVRLVGAPPSSIGKFGSDTDNWMWPRHTGDFSVFRVYADANGNPAEYSERNVPLRPKRWFKISVRGVNEGDYAMMMGFPGRTNHYYTSWEVAERRDIDNTVRINIRELRQKVMLEEMLKDPQVRIQYASKYAGSENAYKNAIGSNWAINKRDFEQVKRAEQEALLAWADEQGKSEYREALNQIRDIVADRHDLRFRQWMLNEALRIGIEFVSVPTEINPLVEALKGKTAERQKELDQMTAAFRRFFDKDYVPEVDKKIAKVMLTEYRRLIPHTSQPAYFAIIDKKYKGDIERFLDDIFAKSIFASRENYNKFLKRPTAKALLNDPMILFAQSVENERENLSNSLKSYDAAYNRAHRTYVKGLLEMEKDRKHWPDANFTLRLTYGRVKPYSPADGVKQQAVEVAGEEDVVSSADHGRPARCAGRSCEVFAQAFGRVELRQPGGPGVDSEAVAFPQGGVEIFLYHNGANLGNFSE